MHVLGSYNIYSIFQSDQTERPADLRPGDESSLYSQKHVITNYRQADCGIIVALHTKHFFFSSLGQGFSHTLLRSDADTPPHPTLNITLHVPPTLFLSKALASANR